MDGGCRTLDMDFKKKIKTLYSFHNLFCLLGSDKSDVWSRGDGFITLANYIKEVYFLAWIAFFCFEKSSNKTSIYL